MSCTRESTTDRALCCDADMSRPNPPYLSGQTTRHGRHVWYVRKRAEGICVRLHAEYGTPEFWSEYRAALAGMPSATGRPQATRGTLRWLWERYRDSSVWAVLAPSSRRARENLMERVLKTGGSAPAAEISRADIVAARESRAKTPSQARCTLDVLRGIFRWALEAGLVRTDPTAGVSNPRRRTSPGFPAWTENDVARYQARWPIGTRERVWLDILLYTGLRRGDAVRLGRQHVRDGIATIRTEKSREAVVVAIPILPPLARALAAGPTGDLAFICGERGQPLTKESFGNLFRQACNVAGVHKSAHGVRKIAATRMAENGASVAQLKAIFGWRSDGMASLYTRTADRARLAREAAEMLLPRTGSEQETTTPSRQTTTPTIKRK
jgi:integrase